MTPEGRVKLALKKYLEEIGAYYFMAVQTGYGRKTLDFLICHKGRFFAVETKKPGELEATPFQRLVIEDIVKAGGACCVESFEDLRNVKRMLF